MFGLIIFVSTVVVISAFCSLVEAILYAVPASHVESLVASGSASGKILQNLRQKIDQPITAILSLNTMTHTLGAAIAGAIATRVLGDAWFGVFSAMFTLAILMLSEILPKTIGVVYSRPLSMVIAQPLQFLVWLLKPFVWLAGLITSLITKGHEHEIVSQEELIVMARMGMHKGVIHKDELAVIQNILSLGDKTVRDVMTPRTVMFSLNAYETVDKAGLEGGVLTHSRIPVYFKDFEDIVGVVHRRDVLTARAENRLEVTLEKLMKPVHFVYEKTSLQKVLKMFLDRAEHLFVVVDEFGGVAGVISLEDILEEILGREIIDEFDQVTDMRRLARKRREKVVSEAHHLPTIRTKRERE